MALRLDIYLIQRFTKNNQCEFSRIEIQNFIKNGAIKVNNKIILKPSFDVKPNYHIEIDESVINQYLQQKVNDTTLKPKEMNIDIVFENENLIVINKPVGLTVHPGAGNANNTLVNGLLALKNSNKITLSDERGANRLGIVHRLDKNTSGLMIIAKNNKSHRLLSELLKSHDIDRRYLALCHGVPIPAIGRIENYICRNKKNIEKMKICNFDDDGAKKAITNYKILKVINNGKYSIVECKLETGRTHQIRLHMQTINHPLVGEQIYTTSNLKNDDMKNNFIHQMLHSYKLKFFDPVNGEKIEIENISSEFKSLLG